MGLAGRSLVMIRANSAIWGTASLLLIYFLGSYLGSGAGSLPRRSWPSHRCIWPTVRKRGLMRWAFSRVRGAARFRALSRSSHHRTMVGAYRSLDSSPLYITGDRLPSPARRYGLTRDSSPEERKHLGAAFILASAVFALWTPVLFRPDGCDPRSRSGFPNSLFCTL